jgi:hypothetical protein
MGYEAVVANGHELAHEGVRLNPATHPDHGPALNLDKRTDHRPVTNLAPIEAYWPVDDYVLAELDVANAGIPDIRLPHGPSHTVRQS